MSIKTALTCRAVGMEAAELLWRWANDPETRGNSFNKAPIPYAEHLAWVRARFESGTTRWWIFSDEDGPVGQIRAELAGPVAELHIVVAPARRGRGCGKAMLTQAVGKLQQEFGPWVRMRASVLEGNPRSLRLFKACGFQEVTTTQAAAERAIILEFPSKARRV